MTQLENDAAKRPPRRDGWTDARRVKFLECLATIPNVRHACAAVGLSRQSAYRLQARDPAFAMEWDDALREAHQAAVRSFIAALPESLRRTLSDSSTSCHLPPSAQSVGAVVQPVPVP